MYVEGIMRSPEPSLCFDTEREGGLAGSAAGGWNADGQLTSGLIDGCAHDNDSACRHGHSDVLLAVQMGEEGRVTMR